MAVFEGRQEEPKDDEAALGCLDMLRGASSLLARHKGEVSRVMPRCEAATRGALERLMADLSEVLAIKGGLTIEASSQQLQQQAEEGGGAARPVSPVQDRCLKRAKGQEAVQTDGGSQMDELLLAPPAASISAGPLLVPEVLEHVMSSIEGRELLGRLSRVCRLWRRVSEGERLCLPVVKRHMPSALAGGERSLHERLGGSARRCLLVLNAWSRQGSLMHGMPRVEGLECMVEVFYDERPLLACHGRLIQGHSAGPENPLTLRMHVEERSGERKEFSAALLGVDDVHAAFTNGRLRVRYCVVDAATGVSACLFHGPFVHGEDLPQPNDTWALIYHTAPVPVTSLNYAGPPHRFKLSLGIRPRQLPQSQHDLHSIHLDRQRAWLISVPRLRFAGQPAIHAEHFIRSRLAEEAMAAKQQGW